MGDNGRSGERALRLSLRNQSAPEIALDFPTRVRVASPPKSPGDCHVLLRFPLRPSECTPASYCLQRQQFTNILLAPSATASVTGELRNTFVEGMIARFTSAVGSPTYESSSGSEHSHRHIRLWVTVSEKIDLLLFRYTNGHTFPIRETGRDTYRVSRRRRGVECRPGFLIRQPSLSR